VEIPELVEEPREVESWEEGDEAVVDGSSGYMLYPSWASQATVAQANKRNYHSKYR
jgi:hypothetical protein